MRMDTYYIEAAVPTPLMSTFDYRVPADITEQRLQPGMRVKVPFGRQQLVAIVLRVKADTLCKPAQIKSILSVIDHEPVLAEEAMQLLMWASDYYHHPVGEVMACALPKKLRAGELMHLAQTTWYQLTDAGRAALAVPDKRRLKQLALLQCVAASEQPISMDCMKRQGFDRALFKRVIEREWVQEVQAHVPDELPPMLRQPALLLSDEQAVAVNALTAARSFEVFVLQGVTGSGKTEVYLQVIAEVLARQQQALVLVPEIGLTPQTIARFERRFHVPVACLHSEMTDSQRLQVWMQARMGEARIVIGTRSALFVSMPELGVIIIDEEHDASFRQQSGFRYVARDMAIMRAKLANVPIVLGSATPSFATLANVERQRFSLLRLDKRVGGGQLPRWQIIDMRDQVITHGLSAPLIERMQHHLANKGQVLIFLNRRGFAPVLICHHCGFSQCCPRCDAHMTLHHTPHRLFCHHCGASSRVPRLCPSCQQSDLTSVGLGTEQLEQGLQQLFPDHTVLRLDRDNVRGKRKLDHMLAKAHDHQADILIGTQLLAKGHHFPALTLVGIVDVDAGLFSADFRALEQLGQTCHQVAGRAGRESHQGEVLLQTHQPEHPDLQCLIEHGYETFAKQCLQQRQQANLPPYSYMAKWVFNGQDRAVVMAFANQVRRVMDGLLKPPLHCFGPMPSLMERMNDRYFVELVCLSDKRPLLHQFLSQLQQQLLKLKMPKQLRWYLEID